MANSNSSANFDPACGFFGRLRHRRTALLILAGTSLLLVGCNKKDYTAYALTSTNSIITFATNKPSDINNKVTVTGLTGSETLLQIAYSTDATSVLYGVTSGNRICTVDPLGGVVSGCVGPFINDTLSNVVMSFDPTTNDLRVIANDTAQSNGHLNALVMPSSGTLEPTQQSDKLSYSDGTNGTPQISAIAYDNPIQGAASTTLYALDVADLGLDRIGDKGATNASSVTSGGVDSLGNTGVTFTSNVGLSIAPQDGTAYAVLGGAASLYTVDLGNGSATLVGTVHDADYTLISLAIAPNS